MTAPLPRLRALLVNDCSLAGHHGSALVTSEIVRLGDIAGFTVTAGVPWAQAEAKLTGGAHGFESVLVNGEGSLHSNARSAQRIAALGQSLNGRVPAYLLNTTVSGNSEVLDRTLARYRLLFVRDRDSQAVLARRGVASAVVHDLTLSAVHLPQARGRGPLAVTDASDTNVTARLIQVSRAVPGASMLTLRAPPPAVAGDRFGRSFAFTLKRAAAKVQPLSPWSLRYAGACTSGSFLNALANGPSGIVCGRYHAVCLALGMSLPFLAIAGNTGKTASLLSDVGLDHRHCDLETLVESGETLRVADFTHLERLRIDRFLAQQRAAASQMFARIAGDAVRFHGIGAPERVAVVA